MQKILLISDSLEASSQLQGFIEGGLPYQVFAAFDHQSLRLQMESKVFNLAVLDQVEFTDDTMTMIRTMRQNNYTFPIVITAENIAQRYQEGLNYLYDIHVLVKPINENSFTGLIRKLLVAHRVPKQNFRRFDTNQIAQVETLTRGDNFLTSMYNLSKGGAYCEYDGQVPMAVGDLLRLKVYLNETNSEYTFNAKVVWTTPKGRKTGRFGCGFKFVSTKDTYRSQLSG